ncbi:hypothetical protein [Planococcus versutus]|uniref:Uncharacterized protein n=1 Tax=Planococcus versutus TaxID=1302659 RepID=A0A1B1RZG3_9BACL|nr:hypothetical protein [Planococcus versutus]ANU26330.1 hypothetical protein I858_004690 [Planococcus versutus]
MSIQTLTNTIQFSPISNIEEYNFHPVLKRFYGMGVQGLVRENIQNSIDGKLVGSDKPVIVNIETGDMKKNSIPGIEEIEDHIHSLVGRNNYTKETIEHMKKSIKENNVRYISFEDLNTRALTGARNGQSNSPEDTFGIYAYNKGFHSEESDASLETARGGSHGIGKIASNAASDIHLMYFANCDEHGDQHLGGTIQLIEHIHEGSCYRASGYFSKVQEIYGGQTKYIPFENDFDQVFQKQQRGLKIVIPFFRKEFDNEKNIIKTVCDNFFVAILNGSLVVNINDQELSAETILHYMKNPSYYEQDTTKMKKEFTQLYVDTYLNSEPKDLVVTNGITNFNFKLYFVYNEEIPKGRVAIFRTMGMKIEDFKVASNASKPFNAVLIGGAREDQYLKSLENESHTKISHESIDDPQLKRQARQFINSLSREIAQIIEEEMKKNNPTDGFMDTGDVLYTTELSFKEELKKSLGTVVINKGKSIIKASIDSPSKRVAKGESNKNGGKRTGDTDAQIGLTRKKDLSDEAEESKEVFSVNPNLVERIILPNKEVVQFNFSALKEMKNVEKCDIAFRIVDGKGDEYPFDLNSNYDTISDRKSQEKYTVESHMVKDVNINEGVIDLEIEFNANYNRSLKFIYYVEV